MDAIVVDTEKTGKDCIQYLREQVSEGLLALYVLWMLDVAWLVKEEAVATKVLGREE